MGPPGVALALVVGGGVGACLVMETLSALIVRVRVARSGTLHRLRVFLLVCSRDDSLERRGPNAGQARNDGTGFERLERGVTNLDLTLDGTISSGKSQRRV